MKKIISTTLAAALVGASAFALVGCDKDNENACQCQPAPAPALVTKTQYVQTLVKAAQSFYGAHKIGDEYEDIAYGELTLTANSEMKLSETVEDTYLDGETEKTVELKGSMEMKTDTTVSVKKVGDYYYIRSNKTVNGTESLDEFDEETKTVYTKTTTRVETVQYDLGAYVNGETVTYYFAKNQTITKTETSTDPDFTLENDATSSSGSNSVSPEENGVAQTTKVYAALTESEYYDAVYDVLENTNDTVMAMAVDTIRELDSDESAAAMEEKYSKDGDNLVLSIDMFGIQDIDIYEGIVPTASGTGKFVINEAGFVSTEMNMAIAAPAGEMGVKMAVNFANTAAFTPLASLDGYELDEGLTFNSDSFEISMDIDISMDIGL